MNFLPLWQDASEGRRHPWLPVLSGVMFSIIILTMAAVPARADEAVKGTVKCRSGIVRKTASTTAECAFCVKEGENILILSESESSDGNKWYQIRLQDQSGYIRSDLVSKSKETVTLNTEPKQENTAQTAEEKPEAKPEETTETAETEKTAEQPDGEAGKEPAGEAAETTEKKAFIRGTSVRIREKEVNGAVVVQLNAGYDITVLDEKRAEDNYTWYRIRFDHQGSLKEGYVRSDFVNFSGGGSKQAEIADEDFENCIAAFPESYKNPLRLLHQKYPKWKIVPVKTGLDWNKTVEEECVIGKNLTSISSIPSWKSKDPRAYNSEKNQWYGFDGGAWAAASPEVICYYLDPRNFLDDNGIFQFETLEYKSYQNETGCSAIFVNSFMSGSYTDSDGITRSYANTFLDAGKQNGISPYHLASRCLQEQGLYGKSDCVRGDVPGRENLFNYFNIGAYAAGGASAGTNGLIYASGTDADYLRPWNTRYRSIMGAARYVSEKYVKKGQDTLYFQKFNVVNKENGIYAHQYMNNISAASAEAARLKRAYADPDLELEFKVPYYENMPQEACAKPSYTSGTDNGQISLQALQ